MVKEKRRLVVASKLLKEEWGCVLSIPEGRMYALDNYNAIFTLLCSSVDGVSVEADKAIPGFNTPAHVVLGVSGIPENGIRIVRACLDEDREDIEIEMFSIPKGRDLTYLHPTSIFVLADPHGLSDRLK